MKANRATLITAAVCLAFGLVAGASGAIAIYERAYGNAAELTASRASGYALALVETQGKPRSDSAVAGKVVEMLELDIYTATTMYESLRPKYRQMLDRAIEVTHGDPRIIAALEGSGLSTQLALYAAAARDCVIAGPTSDTSVGDCAVKAASEIRDKWCTHDGVPTGCALPDGLRRGSRLGSGDDQI